MSMNTPIIPNIENIYIICPEKVVTGGTEALHQLRYYLELTNHKAYIIYSSEFEFSEAKTPERYKQYFTNQNAVISPDDIVDKEENCVIVPEFYTYKLWQFKKVQKVVWWLSVRFYDGGRFMRYLHFRHWIKEITRNPKAIFEYRKFSHPFAVNKTYHLCASVYAYNYVTQHLHQVAYKLIEPISKEFLEIGPEEQLKMDRKNLVAYNPAKPSAIMRRLLSRNEFEFVPIKGMTPEEISKLLRSVKLYVDFGEFPGPERIPKEAVYNGAAIIVGMRNAACNDFDVNIPAKYKIKKYNNIKLVSENIAFILKDYENCYHDFDVFRKQIIDLEANFNEAINRIWG